MLLDKTRIAIRERDFTEICDLALQVVRAYAAPIFAIYMLSALPVMLLNAWLLRGIGSDGLVEEWQAGYVTWLVALFVLESPLIAAPTTLFLGQALFMQKPDTASLARHFAKSLPQLFWFQMVARAMVVPWFITWFFLYVRWPYLNEIILLERNPFRRGKNGQMSTYRRSQILHANSSGDLLGRWFASMFFGTLMIVGLWLTLWFLRGTIGHHWPFDRAMYTVCLPIAIWVVGGFFTVVRFLSYLDLRIRREGWEVELRMRAEAAQLSRGLS